MTSLVPDPEDPTQWLIESASDQVHGLAVGDVLLRNVHLETQCEPYPCVVHRPSMHHMRGWPLHWRGDRGLMERLCPDGVGHPDPDSLAYHLRAGRDWQSVHGCDGCCRP